MRLIDADKIFPWYLKAFSADEIGEERAISPEEIRFSMNDIRGNLENVPTEHPHKWIPVSERLPENNDDVLVWIEYIKDDYDCAWWALAYYSLQYKKWVVSANERNSIVKAWLPLPKPYRTESEGNNEI